MAQITILLCPKCFVPVNFDHTKRDYEYTDDIYKCPKCEREFSVEFGGENQEKMVEVTQ